MVSLLRIWPFSRKRRNYTLIDLSFFESYMKEIEILCYYEPGVDEDSTKLRRRYFIQLAIGLAAIQSILEANQPYTNQGEDIFKTSIVSKREIDEIRKMCLEFLKLEYKIKQSIERMLTSRHKKFRNKAPKALEAFRKLQELMPVLLQAANMED